MFGGVDVTKRFDQEDARYWANVGIDGFFVLRAVTDWTKSVGNDESSEVYGRLRRFQQIYASQGVAYNFLDISAPLKSSQPFGWTPPEIDTVVGHFREAAHLARFAGFEGISLDLEPYQSGFWAVDPAFPNKKIIVYQAGRRIGAAIKQEFPNAEIIVIPEVANMVAGGMRNVYMLSPVFLQGLVEASFRALILGSEYSYRAAAPQIVVPSIMKHHVPLLTSAGVAPGTTSVAIGLWPLGKTYNDKSASETPQSFARRLGLAFAAGQPYVWIYGHGSSWQEDGPYGSGHVDPRFQDFVAALRRVKAQCHAGSPSSTGN